MLTARIREVTVHFTVDGVGYVFDAPSDLSALRAIQELVGNDGPRRGCEQGLCGTCESLVDGQPARLCILPAPRLDGLTIETRRSD